MADEFMREAAGDTGDDQIPHGMLQNGAMPLIDQVADVRLIRLAELLVTERHIAEAPRQFDNQLGPTFRVGNPLGVVVGEEATHSIMIDRLATNNIYLR